MESAQNEFRNEFRRRFHISVDDSEVSRGGENTNIIQRVSGPQLCSFVTAKVLKYVMNIFSLGTVSTWFIWQIHILK